MVDRVIFLGDICRGAQAENVAKIASLFSPVLRQVGVPYLQYISDVNRLTETNEWLPLWLQSLAQGEDSGLGKVDFEGAVVLGFEVPDWDLAYLDRHAIPWVNFAIHPLRFLDDLYFEVTTSLGYDFEPVSATPGMIEVAVQALRARYGHWRGSPKTGTLVVIGQAPFDRSVYFDGTFRKLDDYIADLDALASRFDAVIYRAHPYLSDDSVDQLILTRYGAVRHDDPDVYALLCRGDVAGACAISSSVLTEAPHFGIESIYLEPRAKRFGPAVSYRDLVGDAHFWALTLGRHAAPGSLRRVASVVPGNVLRRTFAAWGYVTDEALRERVLEAKSEARLRQRSDELASRLDAQQHRMDRLEEALMAQVGELGGRFEAQQHRMDRLDEALTAQVGELGGRFDALREDIQRLSEAITTQTAAQIAALQAERDALRGSMSWRITEPLRWVARPFMKAASRKDAPPRAGVPALLRPLVVAMKRVLRDPQLSYRLNRRLMRFPALRAWLVGLSKRAGIYPGLPPSASFRDYSRPNAAAGGAVVRGLAATSGWARQSTHGPNVPSDCVARASVLDRPLVLTGREPDEVFDELRQRVLASSEAAALRQRAVPNAVTSNGGRVA